MSEEENQEKRKTPLFTMKDGVKTWIVPDKDYTVLKEAVDMMGGAPLIKASEYHGEIDAINQEHAVKMRDIALRRADLEARMDQYKMDIMDQNRLNAIVGRPLIPMPWMNPEPRNDDVDVDDNIANGDFDEDDGDYNESDDFDEEDYEDLE